MTAGAALDQAAAELAAAGIEEPRLDAELLLRHATGWDASALIARANEDLDAAAVARLARLVAERRRRRPLQHLTGVAHFWRQELRVTPDVLVPRPETEHLVEAALEAMAGLGRPVVADVGTGSGAIAIALAAERPDALVHAVDLSPAALAVARQNAALVRVGVRFHEGDLLAPLRGQPLDVVVSNPPYVGADEVESLAPEVRDHDPRMALVPPGDRYSVYRRLADEALRALVAGGWLLVEVGQDMDAEVARIFEAAGLQLVRVVPDLQSIPRVVVARRKADG